MNEDFPKNTINVIPQLEQTLVEINRHNSDTTAHRTLISEIALKADQAATYNKTEIDALLTALPTLDLSGQIDTHNTNSAAHEDIRSTILSEIIRATTTETAKVDKIEGKGLSTNDFTNTLLGILNNQSGINTGDETQATIISKLGATPANYDLSNLTTNALTYLKTVCGAIPKTSSNIGQVVSILNDNGTAVAPVGGTWLILYALQTNISNAVSYMYGADNLHHAGEIVAGGTTIISYRNGYSTWAALWRIA